MAKRTVKGKEKKPLLFKLNGNQKNLEPEPEGMGLKILQPEKFKKIAIIGVVFVFIMAIFIFISSLNNIPEEPKSSPIHTATNYYPDDLNATVDSAEPGSIGPGFNLNGELFGLPVIGWVIIVIGSWIILRRPFRRWSL